MHVLIVDDSRDIRDLFAAVLQAHGFRAECAPDGAAGLRAALASAPGLVLLDLEMPRMDGWATIAALRAQAATACTPVILCTAREVSAARVRACRFDGYLQKPVSTALLVQTARRWIEPAAPAAQVPA